MTLDKVVYEAAACGVPVASSNSALAGFLGGLPLDLTFPAGDARALADRLLAFAGAPPETRGATGLELRARVERDHSLERWAGEVVALLARSRAADGESVTP